MNNTGTNINDDKNKALAKVKQKFAKIEGLFDHPSEDISIAGEAIQPLPSIFHGLLQTVSDLMLLLPVRNAIVVTLITMFMQFWLSVFVLSQTKLYIRVISVVKFLRVGYKILRFNFSRALADCERSHATSTGK